MIYHYAKDKGFVLFSLLQPIWWTALRLTVILTAKEHTINNREVKESVKKNEFIYLHNLAMKQQ